MGGRTKSFSGDAGCGGYHVEELPSSRHGQQDWSFPGNTLMRSTRQWDECFESIHVGHLRANQTQWWH